MTGITITTIAPKIPIDLRGAVRELFQGLPGKQVTLYERKAGSAFAGHFHKGIDPAKDPEYFYLILGDISVGGFNGKTNERFTAVAHAGDMIVVSKNIFHRMKALTDVVFIEYRSTVFDPAHPDTFPEEEYDAYIRSL